MAVRPASDGPDVLLIFLLKARRPEVYRDHTSRRRQAVPRSAVQ
jgi:hypothetical protein